MFVESNIREVYNFQMKTSTSINFDDLYLNENSKAMRSANVIQYLKNRKIGDEKVSQECYRCSRFESI